MLKAQDISFEVDSHGEPLVLLNKINFEIPAGHFMAIVGTSGCGKTTLLKTIAGMNLETDGSFFWKDRDLSEEDFDPSEIGYVPQFSIAYDQLTVDENIESAARLRVKFPHLEDMDERIDTVLEETGLSSIADRRVKILSGGQKRRLALAMELVSQPQLLLCDEVTSGLDPQSEQEIVALLRDIAHKQGRIVISVTHSLANLNDYDSVLVLHQGNVAYHGSPRGLAHYFGVTNPVAVYRKLAVQSGEKWGKSWNKHKDSYYEKTEKERIKKVAVGEILIQDNNSGIIEENKTPTTPIRDPNDPDTDTSELSDNEDENEVDSPGLISQFLTLLGRRWKIFFRDRTQLTLQLAMIILFPLMVALFSSKGQDPINKYSAQRDQNIITEIQQKVAIEQNQVKVGSAVSGIIMFEVILLGLMGSNNAAREIAGERPIMEKEKYAGMKPGAYLLSKLAFLVCLIAVQSLWMFGFVEYFWAFRGDTLTHMVFLLLANAAMTATCLGISALSKSPDQSSLLSIYLVGFQLPLSGAVLALPTQFEQIIRPFISAYWAWSGSISSLEPYVYNAVKVVVDTTLSPANLCYGVLSIHILVGIIATYVGVKHSQWD
ncbi:ATP-binding cassette domain-containing protein [Akkermansia sp. N21169]|uniref:ABC transporter ATP-binding protein/permease n=1 Tax=Akkermansia sp. N21169 TaxID=3040765 RepID=UPI00244EFD0E|nr:ATP-binding cassette domain-containing protein [Akkermansia sp. N21169]MDH3069126.1 ATP-binding cassette domain-containing protein [Akkermansia sp. N21169]